MKIGTIFIDPSSIFVIFLLLCVLLQIIFCAKAKRIFIRILPTLALALLTGGTYAMIHLSEGWDPIGYLFLFIFSGIALALCGAIFTIFAIVRKIRG